MHWLVNAITERRVLGGVRENELFSQSQQSLRPQSFSMSVACCCVQTQTVFRLELLKLDHYFLLDLTSKISRMESSLGVYYKPHDQWSDDLCIHLFMSS